jgi:mono/diheme cytochrome c family protein
MPAAWLTAARPAVLLACLAIPATAAPPDADDLRFFEAKVRPVLVERCVGCHGPDKQKAGLRLDNLVGVLRGGESGPAIDLADANASNLVAAIRHESWEMPPDGKLPDDQIDAIVAWVNRGAAWTGSPPAAELLAAGLPEADDDPPATGPKKRFKKSGITAEDRGFWAFRPVVRPALPALPAGDSLPRELARPLVHNAVDHFILARLAAEGIEPVPEADRRTLIRRLFFDLVGMPPAPADVDSFVNDPSSDAYDRLVDRLLADPRYGERMARHWLDVARYAESDGYRQDAFRPTAWRYRDYVVRAFNADMPYDRFVREQLAGDEIAPDDPDAVAATGFLRQTPYEYNIADIERSWAEVLNEVTDVTGDVFLAMGVGCARCHDHKFDPILQRDYYQLQSFFAGLRWRDDVPLVTPAEVAARTDAQRAYMAKVADLKARLRAIEEAATTEKAWAGKLPANRYPPEIQAMVLTPPSRRTPREEQLALFAMRQLTFTPAGLPDDERARYEAIAKELAEFEEAHRGDRPEPAPTTLTVGDVGPIAPPTTIAGSADAAPVEPRIPTVLGGDLPAIAPPAGGSTGRRAALARWIASPDNPLTARVLANRLWQWHFGRGLAPNTSDFGQLGGTPSHPELLDWLAAEFVSSGWSIKHLQRLIVTSAAYRRNAHPGTTGSAAAASDPHNAFVWRFDCRRLDAEQVRDAALAVAGDLDPTAGGPSVPPTKPRRGIYTTVLRNTRDAICDAFDSPDGYTSCAQRNTTTTPMQSLFLINGDWMLARARSLALTLDRSGITDDRQLAAEAIRRVTGREPTSPRLDAAVRFLAEQRSRLDDGSSTLSMALAQRMPQREGRAAVIDPAMPAAVMTVPGSKPEGERKPGEAAAKPPDGPFPVADFTIEAHVILQSLFADATVRTIASQWTGSPKQPGWSFGVTSEKSKYRPRNLIIQLAGGGSGESDGYAVVPSDIHLDLQRPYYVAASVKVSDPADRSVTFYVQDLSDNDAPLVVKRVEHPFGGTYAPPCAFAIGGRDTAADAKADGGRSVWDGLIDDVRLSVGALGRGDLLWERGAGGKVVGFWTFEEAPGFAEDASGQGRSLARGGMTLPPVRDLRRYESLVDLCHVLFNSSEFLYVE